MSKRPRIVVVGSINMDLVIRCQHLPLPGETILAESSAEIPGGKGANQAVAAARAGGDVAMVGRVGGDGFSIRLVESLRQEKIDTQQVRETAGSPSGLAIVAVETSGENSIMVISGANGQVVPNDIQDAADLIAQADCLLVQLEIPLPTVQTAIQVATAARVPVILDPAPMPTSFPDGLFHVDVLCPNQAEASAIIGRPITSIDEARDAIPELHRQGARNAIITMGPQGAVVSDGDTIQWIEPTNVNAIDSTAAGDAFAGALAVQLAVGVTIFAAAKFASVAGAIAATRVGAQVGMPTRELIDHHR